MARKAINWLRLVAHPHAIEPIARMVTAYISHEEDKRLDSGLIYVAESKQDMTRTSKLAHFRPIMSLRREKTTAKPMSVNM